MSERCPECEAGRHVACLDDGSSVWTDKCACGCGDRGHIAWSDLRICGIPVLTDPDQEPGTLKVYDGQTLVLEMHFDGDTFIGATGHVQEES